jgi:hypothetical protein
MHELSEPLPSAFDIRSQNKNKSVLMARNLCQLRKTCAKLGSGVRFGVRFDLERTCGLECDHCTGSIHRRKCRIFTFRPHYDVKLERKPAPSTGQVSIRRFSL